MLLLLLVKARGAPILIYSAVNAKKPISPEDDVMTVSYCIQESTNERQILYNVFHLP
jgi:hypothetical protein